MPCTLGASWSSLGATVPGCWFDRDLPDPLMALPGTFG